MKRYILILLAACSMTLASCSVSRVSVSSPGRVHMEVTMDDFEYLGESEISVEYRTYLGFIRIVDMVNGEPKDRQHTSKLSANNGVPVFTKIPAVFNRAAYKLAEEFPEAEYFRVVTTKTEKTRLFLGGSAVKTAKVKAYRLK